MSAAMFLKKVGSDFNGLNSELVTRALDYGNGK